MGRLRLKFPKVKALFSCIYITQDIPNPGVSEGEYQQTHALLVIGGDGANTT